MSYIFCNCYEFIQSLNNQNVLNVTNITYMFYNCMEFNKPLNNWNVLNVINMEDMFCAS